jgi:hypothetical protein
MSMQCSNSIAWPPSARYAGKLVAVKHSQQAVIANCSTLLCTAAAGETIAGCAVREVMEETGVQIRNNQGTQLASKLLCHTTPGRQTG